VGRLRIASIGDEFETMALRVERQAGQPAAYEGSTSGTAAPRAPSRRWRWAGYLVGAACLAVLAGFGVFLASLDRLEHSPPAPTDGIVALTGGSQRIGDAIDLLAQGFARRLLITGVNERTSRDEIARLNPQKRRLVECCVDLDYRARNTIGNALETRRWAAENRFRSLIVVTSNYHMPRTLAELDHVSPEIEKVPFPVVTSNVDAGAWWHRLATLRLLFAEYAKYVVVLARTRLAALGPGHEGLLPAALDQPHPVQLVAKPAGAR
jgi:uncharacterized SAM-binding protein YcdF (DUF218 family)